MRAAVLVLLLAAGCASSSSAPSIDGPSSTKDAGASADAAKPDPNDGRDGTAASCFASCSNTQWSCLPGSATLQLTTTTTGCSGTSTESGAESVIAIDCTTQVVCFGSECYAGLYSAFTFSYTPGGATETICTRQ